MKKQSLKTTRSGQGMTEYMIIVAMIAIVAIPVVTKFGKSMMFQFGSAVSGFTGNENPVTKPDLNQEDVEGKGLSNFSETARRVSKNKDR